MLKDLFPGATHLSVLEANSSYVNVRFAGPSAVYIAQVQAYFGGSGVKMWWNCDCAIIQVLHPTKNVATIADALAERSKVEQLNFNLGAVQFDLPVATTPLPNGSFRLIFKLPNGKYTTMIFDEGDPGYVVDIDYEINAALLEKLL